jgi:hypothetical protein
MTTRVEPASRLSGGDVETGPSPLEARSVADAEIRLE